MSVGIRLDPATLRAMEAYHFGEAADWYDCRAVAEWHQREYERLRDLADKAEARPPLLSDWIKACEGTALGDPSFEAEGDGISAYFSSNGVTVYLDGMGRETWLWDTVETTRCATPAELRAALDRLAAEASK